MRFSWLLLIPTSLGVAATVTDILPFKMGVPLSCALLLLLVSRQKTADRRAIAPVVGAFFFSAIGDYFLSNKVDSAAYFISGIAAFFVAHIGYLSFSLKTGRLQRSALMTLLTGYVAYFISYLYPAIDDAVLSAAVLAYLLISCFALAAALGMRTTGAAKWLYVLGILLIVVSDTFISLNEFLGYRSFNSLILPTYYLAHLAISLALILWLQRAGRCQAVTFEAGKQARVLGAGLLTSPRMDRRSPGVPTRSMCRRPAVAVCAGSGDPRTAWSARSAQVS